MIAIGIGCRRGVTADAIRFAINTAVATLPEFPQVIASAWFKQDEAGLAAAADHLGLPLRLVTRADMEAAAARASTISQHAQRRVGLSSVAEAAALAAAGSASRLILPRFILGDVTCAVARGDIP